MRKDGFSIVATLGVASVLAVASVVVYVFARTVESETRILAIKHAMQVSEDILRTQIAIQSKALTDRNSIKNFLDKFDPSGKLPEATFRIPINSTKCETSELCYIEVLSFNYEGIVGSPGYPTGVRITLGVKDSENLKTKINPLTIIFPIPTAAEIQSRNNTPQGNLICGLNKPIFLGAKKLSSGQLVAECAAIPTSEDEYTLRNNGIFTDALCLVQKGLWMPELKSKISPKCLVFPDGFSSLAEMPICESPKIAKTFELGNKFVIKNPKCIEKGGVYDFLESNPKWGQ